MRRGAAEVMARDYGRVTGFNSSFVTLYHSEYRAAPAAGLAQSFLPRDALNPPYRITRPFSPFDEAPAGIAFDLDGREVWVERDQVELETGSLRARGRGFIGGLLRAASRRISAGLTPLPAPTRREERISLRVKPLRVVFAALLAISGYLLAVDADPWGLVSAADNYSDVLHHQVFRTGNYERQRELRQREAPPPKVVVVELLEEDLEFYEETWPASYDFHAWVLEEIAEKKPAAVFVNIAFIDDRSYLDDDGEPEEVTALRDQSEDHQRFFGGASAYLGEVIADYRDTQKIPLLFAGTPCLLPFFLPDDVSEGAGTRAVDVPGARFHRQGTRYPLWNHQPKGQRCFLDAINPEARRVLPGSTESTPEIPSPRETDIDPESPATFGVSQEVDSDPVAESAAKTRFARRLPSAACGLFDAVRHLDSVSHDAALCSDQVLALPDVDELSLQWSTRSFEMKLSDGSTVQRNGRYACRELPGHWLERLLAVQMESGKDRLFQFRSPLRQICPPVRSLHVAQVLEEDVPQEDQEPDPLKNPERDLEGAIVIYAQNLTGLEDPFTPPTHLPLNGAYFHAMAIENLLTYRGADALLPNDRTWGLPNQLILMLVGLLFVVPVWEYGMTLLARIERLGGFARRQRAAFRFYSIWLAGIFALPVAAAAVLLLLILAVNWLFPLASLNFIGLLGLLAARSTPRLGRLVPPLWPGLGAWGQGAWSRGAWSRGASSQDTSNQDTRSRGNAETRD
ncbi:CHASE2 domain-containing protein [Denitrobaculum tricleocarpae]|uniref:CHASE2 domain-containing protein n=1 Tax=Denitrobaculum tricleocarpae TaxID=2591009 RepID=A0A545TR76_9PROT|nr:CHASE2 domain-containing protein [Denitrobaculum tricleocarpae]TQV79631.1 CHASE2 domain-containing protein [Denitrobaculum tricleocarpae]